MLFQWLRESKQYSSSVNIMSSCSLCPPFLWPLLHSPSTLKDTSSSSFLIFSLLFFPAEVHSLELHCRLPCTVIGTAERCSYWSLCPPRNRRKLGRVCCHPWSSCCVMFLHNSFPTSLFSNLDLIMFSFSVIKSVLSSTFFLIVTWKIRVRVSLVIATLPLPFHILVPGLACSNERWLW